jgi:SEC-C motif-containing protein
MRSRYSAFAHAARDSQAIEHLLRTHPEPGQSEVERRQDLKASSRSIQWIGLSVLETQDGGPHDPEGTVTFEARWRDRQGREGVLRECSRFGRGEAGEWLYLEALSLVDGAGEGRLTPIAATARSAWGDDQPAERRPATSPYTAKRAQRG